MIVRAVVRLGIVGLAAALALVPLPGWAVERWYSGGLYPNLQSHVTPLTNQVPIALLDVAAACLILAGVWRFARARRKSGFVRAALSTAIGLVTVVAASYLVFLFVWGLNYRRVPVEEKLDLDETRITSDAARQLARDAVKRVNDLHPPAHLAAQNGRTLEQAFAAAERRLGMNPGTVPGVPKRSALELYFRWAAIDGMTNPFFLEVILNPDILAIERPFVLAHEWGHLAGYADEDEANLIAWLTCLEGNAVSQYSGWLAIYGHVMSGLPREERRNFAAQLSPGPRRDLEAIAARYALSKPAVRNVARETYDAYLRANRVEDGIASYDAVVRLILAAGAEHAWAPRALPGR
jgi:Protein of unknown function (DUF3810)